MEKDEMNKSKLQSQVIIKCPHCGYEYAPGEIFYPRNAIGQPNNIIRDPLGHILYIDYREDEEPLAEEDFCCENCGKPFIATIELKCEAKEQQEELDFSDLSVKLF